MIHIVHILLYEILYSLFTIQLSRYFTGEKLVVNRGTRFDPLCFITPSIIYNMARM